MSYQSDEIIEMIEYYNLIRDILDNDCLDLQKCKDFFNSLNMGENINSIPKSISRKIISYFVEAAHDIDEMLLWEKCSHIASLLGEMVKILTGNYLNKKAELLKIWLNRNSDKDTSYHHFNTLRHLMTEIMRETREMITKEEAREEQIVPDIEEDQIFRDEEDVTWQNIE